VFDFLFDKILKRKNKKINGAALYGK